MNYWILPCNLKNYDVISAFKKFNVIQWKQSFNAFVGDKALIYVSAPESKIMFSCTIEEVNLPSVKIDDSDFIVDGTPFVNYGRYLTLKLENKYEGNELSLSTLKLNGLKANLQSPLKTNLQLTKLFNEVIFDFFNEDNLIESNKPRIRDTETWKEIVLMELQREKTNKESLMPYFRYLMEIDGFAMDATSIARVHGKNVGAMNLEVNRFGERVTKEFLIPEQIREGNKQKRFWNIPFTGRYLNGRRFEYTLRNELVEALKKLSDEPEILKQSSAFDDFLDDLIADKVEFRAFLKHKELSHKDLEQKRIDFTKKFSPKFIEEMTLEDYALGRMKIDAEKNKKSFCYEIETGLKDLGSIKGANADKFGVYFDSDEQVFVFAKKWGSNITEAFDNIKLKIVQLLKDGEEGNYNKIHENIISPMLKSKILSVYYPEKYLPFFNEEHVEKFLYAFGIFYDPKKHNTFELKKKLLNNFKEGHEKLSQYSNDLFMEILYHPSMSGFLLGKDNENIVVDEEEIQLIQWDYLDSIKKIIRDKEIIRKKADYIKATENKMKIGDLGEETILRYEKNRLIKLGKLELANNVKRLSEQSDSYGYDILSYDIKDGEIVELHIEVKTSKSADAILNFYLTGNELNRFQNDQKHVIYYLYDVANSPKLHIVDKSAFKSEFLKPVLYKVEVKVKPKIIKS